jgi:branched-chain amino acid transport system permease protein
LGGALAGIAGFVLVEYYGVANFFMGFLIGFKALTAAILGGIGSIRGAVLGGALIAVLETFWSGYLGGNYREVAVFTVLALVLVFRPAGLLGRDPDVFYQDAR